MAEKKKMTFANPTDLALQHMLIRLSPGVRLSPAVRHCPADLLRAAVADIMDLALEDIFVRLSPADLLRAALACKSWRRAAARSLPRVPPLLGYFFHPKAPAMPPPMPTAHHPAVFFPLDASYSARLLSLDFTPYDISRHSIQDVHLGIVLLLPPSWEQFPCIIAIDPASSRQVELLPPPPDALPYGEPLFLGAAVLARAHPSRLTFDSVCLTVYGNRPRAWVVSVHDGNFASWRAWPKSMSGVVDFDPRSVERRGVHAAGNIYWHIADSTRVLELNPHTLDFSFLTVPDALDGLFEVTQYRIGVTPGGGRLCIASLMDDATLQIWVRGEEPRRSDRGWCLQREFMLGRLLDAVPGLPKDNLLRMRSITLSDMDYARTGKVFIRTQGYGHYSFHLKTGKLELLVMEDGKEHGDHPIYAYTFCPPEFLTAPTNLACPIVQNGRKKKAVHKSTTTDDKRLQSTLKRIGVNTIPGIEEVNIFKDDVVIQFQNPKVQASIPANTWVVSGVPQTKSLQDLLPSIINQLGPDNLDNLKRLAEHFQKQVPGAEAGASAAAQDDDDVPELVPGETFEEAAEEKKVSEPEPEEKKES